MRNETISKANLLQEKQFKPTTSNHMSKTKAKRQHQLAATKPMRTNKGNTHHQKMEPNQQDQLTISKPKHPQPNKPKRRKHDEIKSTK